MKLHTYIGLAGVPADEPREFVRKIGRRFESCRLLVVIWLALQWYLEVKNLLSSPEIFLANLLVWFYFIVEVTVLTRLVENKKRYLLLNSFFVLLIIGGGFLLFNVKPSDEILSNIHITLVPILLIPWIETCRASLSDNRLTTTLISALVITILAGLLISGIDPNIPTPWEGIWWAWVTVSTVGYGDVVPVSIMGRILGALLILMGLALFSVITANFAALFLQREVKEVRAESERESAELLTVMDELRSLKADEQDILSILQDIQARLDRLEHQ